MSEAVQRLRLAGFTEDLVAEGSLLWAAGSEQRCDPAAVLVAETVRFEGMTDPADEAILFAVATAEGEPIGTFTAAYGSGSSQEETSIVQLLHQPPAGTTAPGATAAAPKGPSGPG